MVVLSAAVCDAEGQVLQSRQFVSMTRLRIEGLLSAFPKLLGSEKEEGKTKQHTFVETDEVRYIYQPMDSLFVLMVTNKSSNIVQDLQTLRLLAKLIPDYCGGHDEESVSENAFELVFAFDEAISLGYSENVDLSQIRTFTTMDSHEEKLTKIIQDSKISEAKEMAKRRAREIEEAKKQNKASPNIVPVSDNIPSQSFDNEKEKPVVNYKNEKKTKRNRNAGDRKTGWKIGKKPSSSLKDMLSNADDLNALLGGNDTAQDADDDSLDVPVKVFVEEKCSIELERDAALKKFSVQGSLTLWITDPDFQKIKIETSSNAGKIQYKLHPKIDKKAWKSDKVLQLQDSSAGFPVGQNNKFSIVKWKLNFKKDNALPIKPDIWIDSDSCSITLTSNVDYTLNNVVVTVPMEERPEQEEDEDCPGEWQHSNGELIWQVGDVEGGETAKLDLVLNNEEDDEDLFYPISLNFSSNTVLSGMNVDNITDQDDNDVQYEPSYECIVSKYNII